MLIHNTTCCCENNVNVYCIGRCVNEGSAPKNDSIPICDNHKGVITLAVRGVCGQFDDILNKCTIGNNCIYDLISSS